MDLYQDACKNGRQNLGGTWIKTTHPHGSQLALLKVVLKLSFYVEENHLSSIFNFLLIGIMAIHVSQGGRLWTMHHLWFW